MTTSQVFNLQTKNKNWDGTWWKWQNIWVTNKVSKSLKWCIPLLFPETLGRISSWRVEGKASHLMHLAHCLPWRCSSATSKSGQMAQPACLQLFACTEIVQTGEGNGIWKRVRHGSLPMGVTARWRWSALLIKACRSLATKPSVRDATTSRSSLSSVDLAATVLWVSRMLHSSSRRPTCRQQRRNN